MDNEYDRIVDGEEVKSRHVVRTGDFYATDGDVMNIEELYEGGGGGGTDDHRYLSHRNDPNQHNMASITGLDDKLAEVDQEIEDLQKHPLGNEESLFVDFGYQTDISQPSTGYVIRLNKPASNFKYDDRIRVVGNKKELVARVLSVSGGTMAFLTIDIEITPYGIAMRQPVYLFKRTFTLDDAKAVLEATGQEFGTMDHNELENRDVSDQHPISAVSGLSDALEEMSEDLDTKVTQIPGYGLSQANFTPAEKEKLAQVDGPLWLGRYVSVAQLEAAHPANTAPDGARAYVDSGPDGTAREYIVDRDEPMRWVPAGETSGTETPVSVLEKLLENPDTNVLSDSEKAYLDSLPGTLDTKVDKIDGYSLSKNDFTDVYRQELDDLPTALSLKVDKVDGYGLSQNDFTDELLQELNDVPNLLATKVDKVDGYGLSQESFTTDEKTKLSGLSKIHNDLQERTAENAHPLTSITGLPELIPTQATSENQLADKAFVNSSVENIAANYVYANNETGAAFATRADIEAAISSGTGFFHAGEAYTPSKNDYAIVLKDEGADDPYVGMQSRWVHDGDRFRYRYSYSVAFTAAELATLASGINSELVAQIAQNETDITLIKEQLQNLPPPYVLPEATDITLGGIKLAPFDNQPYNMLNGKWNLDVEKKDYDTISKLVISNWTLQTPATNNNWLSVCWSPELRLFCAVGNSGTGNRVMTSPDGINWISQISAFDNAWVSVCWSPELGIFCAVANSGTSNCVMTSMDGVNWISQTAISDNTWRSICWSPELRLFCAVANSGTGNRVMTSPDGINWVSQVSASNNNWFSVCWSPQLGLFCAVSVSGTGNRVMTSPDGINWSLQISPADNNWRSVCWSPELGLFCAVGASGTGNRVMTSIDGVTWIVQKSSVDNNWLSVCWSPELMLFCAMSETGLNNRIMTSPDGINWISQISAFDNAWVSVCWSPELGIFCAVAASGTGNRVMTSLSYNQPFLNYTKLPPNDDKNYVMKNRQWVELIT